MKNIIKIFAYLLLSISLLLFGFSLNFINKWNKQNNQISKQLDETADVYVLKSSTMNLVTFEKIQNKMNLVWVGNDFIEKGFMIKRKFPLFQGELYFWHENEVFNVREVRQNGVDSY